MTSEKLLLELKRQLNEMQSAVHMVELIINHNQSEKKKRAILKSVRRFKGKRNYNGKHWTQTPEGKRRLVANSRKMWREKREKEQSK